MRQTDDIGCPFTFQGIDFDGAFVQLNDFETQSHADTVSGSVVLILSSVERFENLFLVFFRDTYSVIRESQNRDFFPVGDMYGGSMIRRKLAVVFD